MIRTIRFFVCPHASMGHHMLCGHGALPRAHTYLLTLTLVPGYSSQVTHCGPTWGGAYILGNMDLDVFFRVQLYGLSSNMGLDLPYLYIHMHLSMNLKLVTI